MPQGQAHGSAYHWQDYGQGPRRAFALHCGLARGAAWGGVAGALGDLMRLRALDLPGHGENALWDGQGDFNALSLDVVSDAAPEGAFDLIGHSWGGVLALALAVRNPERIRSLSLYEPVFFAVAARDGRPEVGENARAFAPVVAAMEAGDWRAAARLFTQTWGGGLAWEDTPEKTRSYLADRMPTVAAANDLLNRDAGGILDKGRLSALSAPVLLMSGARSPAVVEAVLDGLETRLSDVTRVCLPGADHMAPITRPGEVAAVIRQHLACDQ